jgi:hypothetical protein
MNAKKRPAIDLDAIDDKKLSEISASDFLTALNAGGLTAAAGFHVWPEKKKVELLIGPENFGGIRVGDLLKGFREKKKAELEKYPGSELVVDPQKYLVDPAFIRQLGTVIADQLRTLG